MFKKKKNKVTYDINIYHSNRDKIFPIAYDVHLDGKLIASDTHSSVSVAKLFAQDKCKEHSQLGKYKYTV